MNLTATEENYLKEIYHLQQQGDKVFTNQLAEQLQTTPASVTDMLKKLHIKSLVAYERYQGFELTHTGASRALEVIRRHRLWEYFLCVKLGFDWNEVHPLAEQLEHVSSVALIEKLDTYLGNPQADPHGDPIPDAAGNLPAMHHLPLTEAPLQKTMRVTAVANQAPDLLDMLNQLQIHLGASITIRKKFGFDGSLDVLINRKHPTVLPETIARHLFVQPLNPRS